MKSGDPATALSDPYSVILTKETAQRFFDDRNPLGETFSIEGMDDFSVTGILQVPEEKTHLRLGLLVSMSSIPLMEQQPSIQDKLTHRTWDTNTYAFTYVLLKAGAEKGILDETLAAVSRQETEYLKPESRIQNYRYDSQIMDNILPGEELWSDIGAGKTRSALELMMWSIVALVILLMACFNYTNLSIARALRRAREVGIYKVMGG